MDSHRVVGLRHSGDAHRRGRVRPVLVIVDRGEEPSQRNTQRTCRYRVHWQKGTIRRERPKGDSTALILKSTQFKKKSFLIHSIGVVRFEDNFLHPGLHAAQRGRAKIQLDAKLRRHCSNVARVSTELSQPA